MMKFFEIKNKTPTTADLYFYGDIVSDGWGKWTDEDRCPQDIINLLKDCEGVSELNIYINSGGGSVWGGVAIYNILKRFSAKKTVHIDGVAASIASVIALSGDKIIMPENSFIMIHKAIVSAYGNANDLRETADLLEQIEKSIVNTYMEHVQDEITEDYVMELMSAETWLSAKEASSLFKGIEVTDSNTAVACISDYKYQNVPKGIFKAQTPENTPPKHPDNPKEPTENFEQAKNKLNVFKNFMKLEDLQDE